MATTGIVAPEGFDLRGEAVPARDVVRDVWRARDLIRTLARKEFFVRYRRASFGLLWAVALPLVQAVVLAAVFSRFVRFDTNGNYTVFMFAGTMAWTFFSQGVAGGSTSVVENAGLSSKIYFPRTVFPLVTVLSGLYGLVITSCVLAVLDLVTERSVGPEILLLAPAVLLTVILTASIAVVASVLQVYFRDVRWLLTAALVPWFYLTPIVYPLSASGRLEPWLRANPTTGAVELFRAATVGADPGWLPSLWWALGWCAVLLAAGVALQRRYDRVLSDLL